MTMTKPSAVRFGMWAILTSMGFLSLLWERALAPILFLLSSLVLMRPEQMRRVIPRRDIVGIAWCLLLVVAAIVALKTFVPAAAGQAVERFMRFPVVVLLLWGLFMAAGYYGWRRTVPRAAQPDSPANVGQPLSPDSTSTPPAAGPRR